MLFQYLPVLPRHPVFLVIDLLSNPRPSLATSFLALSIAVATGDPAEDGPTVSTLSIGGADEVLSYGFGLDDGQTFAAMLQDQPEGGAEFVIRTAGGDPAPAVLLARDGQTGLAFFRCDSDMGTVAQFGESPDGAPGAEVHVINAAGDGAAVRSLIIGREISHGVEAFAVSLLHLHCDRDLASPGLPVVAGDGALVGVVRGGVGGRPGSCFVLPVEAVFKAYTSYRTEGKIEPAWVGIVVDSTKNTPMIIDLREGSPARASGLLPGDVITKVGDRDVRGLQDIVDACYYLKPDVAVSFSVLRGLEPREISLVPGRFPEPELGASGSDAGESVPGGKAVVRSAEESSSNPAVPKAVPVPDSAAPAVTQADVIAETGLGNPAEAGAGAALPVPEAPEENAPYPENPNAAEEAAEEAESAPEDGAEDEAEVVDEKEEADAGGFEIPAAPVPAGE